MNEERRRDFEATNEIRIFLKHDADLLAGFFGQERFDLFALLLCQGRRRDNLRTNNLG